VEAIMPGRPRGTYRAFRKWELELTTAKVRNLSGEYGLTTEDLEELQQELLLHIFIKRRDKAYWKTIRVSEKTLIDRILDNQIRNFIDSRHTRKHQILTSALPFEGLKAGDPDDDPRSEADPVSEDVRLYGVRQKPAMEEVESRLEVRGVFPHLTPLQRKAARLYMKDYRTSEIARLLGINRTQLEREKKKILRHFLRREMGSPKMRPEK
jgi:DNA-directed RNA polymerase specialized sigma24 family protein